MSESKSHKCAHPACSCQAPEGSKYCGAYCEGSAERPSVVCECGHPGCEIASR
jgi:hypothetical protein